MKRVRASLRGAVQGVGFRPFVRRTALAHQVAGLVRNEPSGVHVEAEGEPAALSAFFASITAQTPFGTPALHDLAQVPLQRDRDFVIAPSATEGHVRASLPADLAPCSACLAELNEPGRRHRYPFTSCTQCGPRWSIALGAPWDRARTTMAPFRPCHACAREYEALDDRRAHAQTLACARCGPRLWLRDAAGTLTIDETEAALEAAVQALLRGEIVALKGTGGWQLLADATCETAVLTLRRRKCREARPFAVLFADLTAVCQSALVSAAERVALEAAAAPIVLLAARTDRDARSLAPAVAPSSRLLGAMLAASPLHALLARDTARPLVCTSGNLADEPLSIEDEGDSLAALCDLRLGHDRRIARPLDDSVVRVTARGPILLRRARGFVPRALPRHERGPVVLALGAHLKASVALALDDEIWLSAPLGDLRSASAIDRLESTARELLALAKVRPDVVACDLHPDYASSLLAESLARETGARLLPVPHHAAHVAAIAAEHGLQRPLHGFAWDGMGLGEDGVLWGGESIVLDGPDARRVAHLRPFRLPGGDAAIREPRRSALGLLAAAGLPDDTLAHWFSQAEWTGIRAALASGVNAPWTTSMGRLFDAVAALTGLRGRSRFEAEAALELEQSALSDAEVGRYPLALSAGLPKILDWVPMISALLDALRSGTSTAEISARFHATLAHAAGQLAQSIGVHDVALAGGCFQNARLLSSVATELEAHGHTVWQARELPPGDGGLSVGQALLAARRFSDVSRHPR